MRRPNSPLNELVSLRQAMDNLFDDGFFGPRAWSWPDGRLVKMDVYTTDDEFVVEAHMPGVKPEDADITVEGNTLTIAGEIASSRKDEQSAAIVREITRGRFSRSFTLPNGLEPDKADANFENGVLTIRIPKAEQVKPRQIKINAGGSPNGSAEVKTK